MSIFDGTCRWFNRSQDHEIIRISSPLCRIYFLMNILAQLPINECNFSIRNNKQEWGRDSACKVDLRFYTAFSVLKFEDKERTENVSLILKGVQ